MELEFNFLFPLAPVTANSGIAGGLSEGAAGNFVQLLDQIFSHNPQAEKLLIHSAPLEAAPPPAPGAKMASALANSASALVFAAAPLNSGSPLSVTDLAKANIANPKWTPPLSEEAENAQFIDGQIQAGLILAPPVLAPPVLAPPVTAQPFSANHFVSADQSADARNPSIEVAPKGSETFGQDGIFINAQQTGIDLLKIQPAAALVTGEAPAQAAPSAAAIVHGPEVSQTIPPTSPPLDQSEQSQGEVSGFLQTQPLIPADITARPESIQTPVVNIPVRPAGVAPENLLDNSAAKSVSHTPAQPPKRADRLPGQAANDQALSQPIGKQETESGVQISPQDAAVTPTLNLLAVTDTSFIAGSSPLPAAPINQAPQGLEDAQQLKPLRGKPDETPAVLKPGERASATADTVSSETKPAVNPAAAPPAPADGQSFVQNLVQIPPSASDPAPADIALPPAGQIEAGSTVITEKLDPARTQTAHATQRPESQHPQSSPPIRDIAVHIVQHADSGVNRFQLRLDPPELGRVEVRMEISPEGKLSAVIAVERPETLDLLQRDSRALERSLEDAGLKTGNNSLNFSLKGGRQENYAQESPGSSRIRDDTPFIDDHDVTLPSASFRFASRAVNITI